MSVQIRKVGILGAGVMGSGIAAHLAGAGLEVLLLDILPPREDLPKGSAARNSIARSGIDRALQAKPAAFFSPEDAALIKLGNFDDDLEAAAHCDLIIEVVKEDLAIKQALFARLEPLLLPHSIVTSNTSGLPISLMMAGRGDSMKRRFLVTHFFNPVRYMKLLEVIAGSDTDPEVVKTIAHFGAEVLGKGVVFGKDTPNFVANRIGVFAMMHLIREVTGESSGRFTIEEVDSLFGPALGRPKSAVFRTADLVGVDTIVDVAANCYQNLPHDEQREEFKVPRLLDQMVQKRLLGDKTGGGFSKKTKDGILTLDFDTLQYRPQQKPTFQSVGAVKSISDVRERVRKFLDQRGDRGAELARRVTLATLAYASHRVGEIADDLLNIDRAMRWGFGWELGPFETWDALGVGTAAKEMESLSRPPAAWVKEMLNAGRKSFYEGDTYWDASTKSARIIEKSPRKLDLPKVKGAGKLVFENDGASLYDIGDRIACLEFHTKMNALDPDVISMIHRSIEEAERRFDGLVIANQAADAFSAGANIFLIVMAAQQKNWKAIEDITRQLQEGCMRMKYARVPVVTAPFGLTLGGGAEVAMAGFQARAHAELYMGLVEAGVGLIPAGGGCKELLARSLSTLPEDADPFPLVKRAFMNVAMGKVSTSAEEARAMGMLDARDGVTLNRDFLVHDAKEVALGLARAGYRALRPRTFRLPGEGGYGTLLSALQMMHQAHQISEHDVLVGSKLAYVLCGGRISSRVRMTEQHVLDLEREAFLSLCGEAKTQERMQYMLMNNRPLRN
jgi:3-hydroxyacyl-CoA dehydrogenase